MFKNVLVTRTEPTKLKLHLEVDAVDFDKAAKTVYEKVKGELPAFKGFRPGKCPRKRAENLMSEELKSKYETTVAKWILDENYSQVLEERKLKPLVQPHVTPTQVGIGKDLIIDVDLIVRPEITLKQYSGIEIVKTKTLATEEEIDKDLAAKAKKSARLHTITDRPIQLNDIATIDYSGFIDGVLFEGGSGKDYALEIGSNRFVPGFETQLIGLGSGGMTRILVKFADDYHPSVAGKNAIFEVFVKLIQEQEIPAIDNDFAEDIGFDSLEDLRNDVRAKIQERLDQQDKDVNIGKIMNALLEENGSDIIVPHELIIQTIQQLIQSGKKDTPIESITADIRKEFILDHIAETENIEATEEDLKQYYESVAAKFNMPVEVITANLNKELKLQAQELMRTKATMDFLYANCIEKAE